MRPLPPLLVVAAIMLGVVTGLSSSKPTLATSSYDLYVQPGGASSYMTCGWHGTTGCPNAGGYGLDWSSASGASVYFRSFGGAVPATNIGTGYPGDASSTCTRAKVQVRSVADIWRGDVIYTHAEDTATSSFTILGNTVTSPAFTSSYVGYTLVSEVAGCPFFGQHLHQYNSASASGNSWAHNTNVYPNATNPGNWDPYNIAYWQAKTSWSE